MVILFHFTKSQSRETGKCGVPSLVSLEAPDSGGSPPDSPRDGSLPSLGLCEGQEWRGHGRSDTIVSVHTTLQWREGCFCSGRREENPRQQLCLVGPGDHCCGAFRPAQQLPHCYIRSAPLEFTDQNAGGAIQFPRNATDFSFARLPASLAFQKGVGWGDLP